MLFKNVLIVYMYVYSKIIFQYPLWHQYSFFVHHYDVIINDVI